MKAKLTRAIAFQAVGFAVFVGTIVWIGRSPPVIDSIVHLQKKIGAACRGGAQLWGGISSACIKPHFSRNADEFVAVRRNDVARRIWKGANA